MRVLLKGSSGEIGKAIAKKLSSEGWEVISPPRKTLDLGNRSSISLFIKELIDEGALDALVLNAGVNDPTPVLSPGFSDAVKKSLEINLLANNQIVQATAGMLSRSTRGSIVAVSSLYGKRARAGRASYSQSKAALEAFIRTLSVELAPSGIRSNSVAPGFIETPLTKMNNTPSELQAIVDRIPCGNLGRPADVAGAVSFLVGPDALYINGQTIVVDGGFSCT